MFKIEQKMNRFIVTTIHKMSLELGRMVQMVVSITTGIACKNLEFEICFPKHPMPVNTGSRKTLYNLHYHTHLLAIYLSNVIVSGFFSVAQKIISQIIQDSYIQDYQAI